MMTERTHWHQQVVGQSLRLLTEGVFCKESSIRKLSVVRHSSGRLGSSSRRNVKSRAVDTLNFVEKLTPNLSSIAGNDERLLQGTPAVRKVAGLLLNLLRRRSGFGRKPKFICA